MGNILLILFQILPFISPKKEPPRPYINATLETVAKNFERDKDREKALVASQTEEHENYRRELQLRFETATADEQQRILKALQPE